MTDLTSPTQSKMVRCQDHGVYYNPNDAVGCLRCIEGPGPGTSVGKWRRGHRSRSRPSPLVLIAFVGLLVFAMTRSQANLESAQADREEQNDGLAPQGSGRIDPNHVRSQIAAVEALVYAGQSQPGIGGQIEAAAMDLHEAMSPRVSRAMAARYSGQILGFGSRAAAEEDIGYAMLDLDRARTGWETLRAEVFEHAPWFRQ